MGMTRVLYRSCAVFMAVTALALTAGCHGGGDWEPMTEQKIYVSDRFYDVAVLDPDERELLAYGTEALESVEGLRLVGTAEHKAAVLSFVLEDAHAHDIGTILDQEGIAVRTGHHCAQPAMDRFGVPATARASLALYNTKDDLDALVRGLEKVREVFA